MTGKVFNEPTGVLLDEKNRLLLTVADKGADFPTYSSPLVEDLIQLQTGQWGYGGGLFQFVADSKIAYFLTSTMDPTANMCCRLCKCGKCSDMESDLAKDRRYKVSAQQKLSFHYLTHHHRMRHYKNSCSLEGDSAYLLSLVFRMHPIHFLMHAY